MLLTQHCFQQALTFAFNLQSFSDMTPALSPQLSLSPLSKNTLTTRPMMWLAVLYLPSKAVPSPGLFSTCYSQISLDAVGQS